MFEKVLVPLDGTDVTTRVLPYVMRLATDVDASVTLFSVVQTSIFDEARRGRGRADRHLVDDIKQRLRETASEFGVDAEVEVSVGNPAEEIVSVAERGEYGLIAMVHHGRNMAGMGVLGSVTDRVVHTSSVPVVSMSPERQEMFQGHRAVARVYGHITEQGLQRFLVPLDGTLGGESILPYVETLARVGDRRITLAHAVGSLGVEWVSADTETIETEIASRESKGAEYIERTVRRLRESGLNVDSQIVSGHPASALVALARDTQPDLIALATRPTRKWSLGSVAEALVRSTGDPVLVVRQPFTSAG